MDLGIKEKVRCALKKNSRRNKTNRIKRITLSSIIIPALILTVYTGISYFKTPTPEQNRFLMTTIKENGPREEYVLSLYAVNERTHKQFTEWQDHKVFGGLPMLPERRKLDSVKLELSSDV